MAARVIDAQVLEGYRLRLTFADGVMTEADFSDDLWGPLASPLRDPAYFAQVRVDPEARTVVWPNGFDPDPDLLHGDYEAAPPSRLRVKRLQPAR